MRAGLTYCIFLPALCFYLNLTNANEPSSSTELTVQIFDKQALALIAPDAQAQVLAEGFTWVEGPLWLEQQACLIFSDIPSHRVLKFCPDRGVENYLENSGYSNGLILNAQGELVLMQSRLRQVGKMLAPLDAPASNFQALATVFGEKRLNSPNDVTRASDGSLYFTDPPYGLEKQLSDPAKELDFQGIYKLSPNGELSLLDDSLTYPNGILLLAQERALVVAVSDSEDPAWYVYDVDQLGQLSNRRRFAGVSDYSFERSDHGLPDGLKQHSNGTLLATGPGGVWMFSPQGKLLAHLGVDRPVANLALDADESTLYLTAQDKLMAIALKTSN